ncbi:MAG: NAD(P)H-hydrate dehydratase, partial [Plesiomonas sp.]
MDRSVLSEEIAAKASIATSLPHSLYDTAWVRRAEQHAVAALGISLWQLMQRAGAAAWQWIEQHHPALRSLVIVCGNGNNGGDGLVLACLAAQAGVRVSVYMPAFAGQTLVQPAQQALQAWLAQGGHLLHDVARLDTQADLVVDALLGIGVNGAVRPDIAKVIQWVNTHSMPVLALDIPSGLQADSGTVAGVAVQADATLTLVALKRGLFTGQARDYTGQIYYAALGLESWLAGQPALQQRLSAADLGRYLPARRPCSHKGEHGRVLVLGGELGTGGAVCLAAEAALRSGAGLVRVLTRAEHVPVLLTRCPEVMVQAYTPSALKAALDWAQVIACGPGLGQSTWAQEMVAAVQESGKPTLWDADALNVLAQTGPWATPAASAHHIFTPHPGEAARLLGCTVAQVEQDRFAAVRQLQQRWGGVVILKGAGTLIANREHICLADVGNPGMASGGSGDVLSGICAALLAQRLCIYARQCYDLHNEATEGTADPLLDAACAAVLLHGAAADQCALQGMRGMLASDLLP